MSTQPSVSEPKFTQKTLPKPYERAILIAL